MNIYRKYLDQVNSYIVNSYFVNPYIEYQMKGYIKSEIRLSNTEKKYLINKIDGFRHEYLKGIGNGNYNIFKLSKRIISYENIYFILCHIKLGNLNNEKKYLNQIRGYVNSKFVSEIEKSKVKEIMCKYEV